MLFHHLHLAGVRPGGRECVGAGARAGFGGGGPGVTGQKGNRDGWPRELARALAAEQALDEARSVTAAAGGALSTISLMSNNLAQTVIAEYYHTVH